jgi:CheY-like chemotaxis protein
MALILVVDDQDAMREVVSMMVTQLGHEVLTCSDGKQALRVMESKSVDLVLTDILMPHMDGIELVRILRRDRPGLPVIVMSDGGQLDRSVLLRTAGLLGAVDTLGKPFGPEDLAAAVQRVLEAGSDGGST